MLSCIILLIRILVQPSKRKMLKLPTGAFKMFGAEVPFIFTPKLLWGSPQVLSFPGVLRGKTYYDLMRYTRAPGGNADICVNNAPRVVGRPDAEEKFFGLKAGKIRELAHFSCGRANLSW